MKPASIDCATPGTWEPWGATAWQIERAWSGPGGGSHVRSRNRSVSSRGAWGEIGIQQALLEEQGDHP
jgi:hypothetical protein